LLLLLVRRPGALLTKEELMSSIWGESFVEESNLTVAASTLRRALNEDPHDRRYIQTVARRGYRFIAEVRELHEMPRTAMLSSAPRSSPIAFAAQKFPVPDELVDSEIDKAATDTSQSAFVPAALPAVPSLKRLAHTFKSLPRPERSNQVQLQVKL